MVLLVFNISLILNKELIVRRDKSPLSDLIGKANTSAFQQLDIFFKN